MDFLLILGCGTVSWLGCFVLCAGESRPSSMVHARLRRTWSHARHVLALLASLRLVRALAQVPAWDNLGALVRDRLRATGLGMTREESVASLVLAVFGVSLVGGVASRSVVGAGVLAGICIVGVYAVETSRSRRRANALAEEMPGIFRTLSIAIGSGQTLSQAIDYVGAHESGPAAEEFARTSLRLRCGISAEEALSSMVDELDAPGVGLLVTALLISQRTGSPLRDLFQRSAKLVERQGEFERTLAVKTAQVRLSVRIVCLLPVVMIATLSLISPDFQQGLGTALGAGSVLVALGMDAAALLIIRKLMRGVL